MKRALVKNKFYRLPMRYGLSGAGLTTYNDKIFITGGVGAGGILKAVKRTLVYDHKSNQWYLGPPMNEVSTGYSSQTG